jgi:hypothetical protein
MNQWLPRKKLTNLQICRNFFIILSEQYKEELCLAGSATVQAARHMVRNGNGVYFLRFLVS